MNNQKGFAEAQLFGSRIIALAAEQRLCIYCAREGDRQIRTSKTKHDVGQSIGLFMPGMAE